jgi:hypothetical protein
MGQESPENISDYSAERGWFADMERALEHDTPELVLKTVADIYTKYGDKLRDDERSLLERAQKWAHNSIELRNERNKAVAP